MDVIVRRGQTYSVSVHAPAGDWSIFRPNRVVLASQLLTENMDLSPSVAPRGTVPFSRRHSQYCGQYLSRRENRDSPL